MLSDTCTKRHPGRETSHFIHFVTSCPQSSFAFGDFWTGVKEVFAYRMMFYFIAVSV